MLRSAGLLARAARALASSTASTSTSTAAAAASAVTAAAASTSSPSLRRALHASPPPHSEPSSAPTKATTGIVGLAVDPAARATALAKLRAVAEALDAAGVPSDAQYRKGVDGLVAQRLAILQSGASDAEVEAQLGLQLEQVARQCDDELELVAKMAEWKPWAVPAGTTVELRVEKPVEE